MVLNEATGPNSAQQAVGTPLYRSTPSQIHIFFILTKYGTLPRPIEWDGCGVNHLARMLIYPRSLLLLKTI